MCTSTHFCSNDYRERWLCEKRRREQLEKELAAYKANVEQIVKTKRKIGKLQKKLAELEGRC